LPVIENLISSSDSLQNLTMAIDLIRNANELVASKLWGIKICELYAKKFNYLKDSCIAKIQIKTNQLLTDYFEQLITNNLD
jgi:hypothetical protein